MKNTVKKKAKEKYSKDPKVELLSLKEFLQLYDYFKGGIPKKFQWKTKTVPCENSKYLTITADKMVAIIYGSTVTNFGMDTKAKLEIIQVAIRDGKTEYELFDAEIEKLKAKRRKCRTNKRLDLEIHETEEAKKQLPEFKPSVKQASSKSFKDYLVDTGRKFDCSGFERRYVVFDVETNGLRKKSDDLLSLSIYDPSSGFCYNRFFPLDLQPVILTGFINGISDEKLADATHITQEEMDEIIDFFDLKNSVLLSYSGGKGVFDSAFVINYCNRHKVTGFENLEFKNIKDYLSRTFFGLEGKLTKDNLCKLFGIDGVADIHSGLNDCILEWQLFEKLAKEPLFFIQNRLYRFHKGYIIPVTYLNKNPDLAKAAEVKVPSVLGYPKTIFEYEFPKRAIRFIEKFDTNFNGIAIENAINSLLDVEIQDNSGFLAENRKHLEYIGSLDSRYTLIPIITKNDGTISTTDPLFEDHISKVNKATKVIMKHLSSTIDFIKKNIFCKSRITSQELVISEDRKILALCDLSSDNSILEIKTTSVLEEDGFGVHLSPSISRQLYYQRKGRKTFVLSVILDTHRKRISFGTAIDSLTIKIYEIDLREVEMNS